MGSVRDALMLAKSKCRVKTWARFGRLVSWRLDSTGGIPYFPQRKRKETLDLVETRAVHWGAGPGGL